MKMKLSKHFLERWRERVKRPVPKAGEVKRMVNDAVYLQRSRDFFTPRGVRVRVMALYWVPHENLVLKVDERNNMAVTVLTPNMTDDEVI